MNVLLLSVLALGVCVASIHPLQAQSSRKNAPTKLAHFQTAAYLAGNGTKLRINIDKQLNGEVSVALTDIRGLVYFYQVMGPADTTLRLSLNVSDLTDGTYSLKISNGLDEETRTIQLTTPVPKPSSRTVTLL